MHVFTYRLACIDPGNTTLLKYDSTWRRIIKIYKENSCLEKVGPHTED